LARLLALAGTGWVLVSSALITLLAPVPMHAARIDFHERMWCWRRTAALFALWLAHGQSAGCAHFCLQCGRDAAAAGPAASRLWQAVLTSWQAVLANPATMALWTALLILALTLLGMVHA
jgi:hypothetical protein